MDDKEDVVHLYNGILLSHKKNEIMPCAAAWMDPEMIILSEVSCPGPAPVDPGNLTGRRLRQSGYDRIKDIKSG